MTYTSHLLYQTDIPEKMFILYFTQEVNFFEQTKIHQSTLLLKTP